MISELAATRFSLMNSDQQEMFALSNPYVSRGTSFVDDFKGTTTIFR